MYYFTKELAHFSSIKCELCKICDALTIIHIIDILYMVVIKLHRSCAVKSHNIIYKHIVRKKLPVDNPN